MDLTKRVTLAVVIVAADTVLFFIPLTALVLAYILIANPPWFTRFINQLGSPEAP